MKTAARNKQFLTGRVWSVNTEVRETTSLTIFNPIAGELQTFPKRVTRAQTPPGLEGAR